MSKKIRNRRHMQAVRWFNHYGDREGYTYSWVLFSWMGSREIQTMRRNEVKDKALYRALQRKANRNA